MSEAGAATAVVVLAAGKGKRMGAMNGNIPKVLTPLDGRPMIAYLLRSIKQAHLNTKTVVVVGYGANQVQKALGPAYSYVVQDEQLGTAHAVWCAEGFLKDRFKDVIVLYGDHPLVRPATIQKLHDLHRHGKQVITFLTTQVPDFSGWRAGFYDFGRILRDEQGQICGIRERQDAGPQELAIGEVNTGLMVFESSWLWQNLPLVKKNNIQREYYLTDLIRVAIQGKHNIATLATEAFECTGINTPEHLVLAHLLIGEYGLA